MTLGSSGGWSACGLPFARSSRLPRDRGDSSGFSAASRISLRLLCARSLLLAALSLRIDLASASRSFRFRSRRFSFRCSFSKSRAHHPASESHRCASTCSMTISMSTPALRIRSRTSFSSCVENGAGCCILRISCCCGACSPSHGFFKMSLKEGRISGRLDSSFLMRSLACSGMSSGYLGSS